MIRDMKHAGFGDEKMEPRAKKCVQSLEAGTDMEMDYPLDFSPMKSVLNFSPAEL